MLKEKTYYLYRHIRQDINQVFYIGIGVIRSKRNNIKDSYKYQRAYTKGGRNKHWNNIINKSNYKIQVILESNNREFIEEKEKEFIKLYGRRDLKTGTLTNLTDGGEGILHCNLPESHKKASSERMKLFNKKRWANHNKIIKPLKNNKYLILDTQTGIYYNTILEVSKAKQNFGRTYITYMLTGKLFNKTSLTLV